jgi:hypothetical protein
VESDQRSDPSMSCYALSKATLRHQVAVHMVVDDKEAGWYPPASAGGPSGEMTPSPLLLRMFVMLVGWGLEGIPDAMAGLGLSRTPERDG